MSRRFCLVTCSNFDGEVQAVQSSPDLEGVSFHRRRVACDLAEASWPGLAEFIAARAADGGPVGIAGGYCLTRLARELSLDRSCRLHRKSQCYEWVADKEVLDRFLEDGALPVLPGWLKDWPAHVDARWPSDRKAAQSFFRDVARKVVLLDTGVYPGIESELKSFARFLRLPHEVHFVGLEYFRLAMARAVLSWRADRFKAESRDRADGPGGGPADLARVGHLFSAVTGAQTPAEAEAGMLELFRSVLAPERAAYHPLGSLTGRPVPEGSPLDRIVALNAEHAWADERTVFLKIAHGREILGVLELAGLGGSERGGRDLDLALTLSRISGLALGAVRLSQSLEAARERAASAEASLASGEDKLTRMFSYPIGTYRVTPQGKIMEASPTLARMLGYPDVPALRAVNFWDLHVDSRDRDQKQAFLDSTSMIGIFESQLRRANGTSFWAEDSCRAAKGPGGKVVLYDGVIEDITARKKMKDEHSWFVHLQTAVGEVSARLLSPTPIEEISFLVMERARRLTSSATAFVGHVDGRTGRLIPSALTPDARDMLCAHDGRDAPFHGSSGMWRWVLEKKRAIVTSVPSLDPRYTGMPPWHLPVGHFMAVPAVMSGTIVGLIVVANADDPYVERDLNAVERLADLYAIAVERIRTEEELREMSLVDELTKAYNRRGFMTLAEQQIKVAHRTRKEMSLFYADLDDLKAINDSYGHEDGDAALVEAVGVLREVFRDSDIIARLGGDEFVVLAIDVAEGKGAALSRRLKEKLQARNARGDLGYPLSFSLGVVRYDPDRPCSLQELLTLADKRMYEDKTSKKAAAAVA